MTDNSHDKPGNTSTDENQDQICNIFPNISVKRWNILDRPDSRDCTAVTMTTYKGRYRTRVVGLQFRLTSGCHPAMLSQFIMEFQRSIWSEQQNSMVCYFVVISHIGLVEDLLLFVHFTKCLLLQHILIGRPGEDP